MLYVKADESVLCDFIELIMKGKLKSISFYIDSMNDDFPKTHVGGVIFTDTFQVFQRQSISIMKSEPNRDDYLVTTSFQNYCFGHKANDVEAFAYSDSVLRKFGSKYIYVDMLELNTEDLVRVVVDGVRRNLCSI